MGEKEWTERFAEAWNQAWGYVAAYGLMGLAGFWVWGLFQ